MAKGKKSYPKKDPYQEVTNTVLALLEKGDVPWHRPWKGGSLMAPKSYSSRKPYRGINTLVLAMEAMAKGYTSNHWITFAAAKKNGGSVRKGEKSTPVVWYQWVVSEKEDKKTGEKKTLRFPMLRMFRVFNMDQVDGVEKPKDDASLVENMDDLDFVPIEKCEEVLQAMKEQPEIVHNEQRAYYRPSTDLINMPRKESFESAEEYYSTEFHELGHWTGHESRLDRSGIAQPSFFGSHEYSREELVAEMTAAFLCGICGIAPKVINNSAAYIKNWMSKLSGDKMLVVQAAAQAQKAADYILGIEREEAETEETERAAA
jgi:antirestriction protein ArdC